MKHVRALTRLLEPTAGISFVSYVEQMAAMYRVSLQVMQQYLGLIDDERYQKLNGYGIFLDSDRLENFCRATLLSKETCEKMLLSSYSGIAINLDRLQPGDASSLRKVALSEWAYFSGSHICPQCIEESGGAWQLAWKLPWSYACVKHKCFLVASCPSCLRRTGSGRIDKSLSPVFVKVVPSPSLCRNPRPFGEAGVGKSAEPCGFPLAEIPTVTCTSKILSDQQSLNLALSGVPQVVLGDQITSLEYFADLRSLSALLFFCAEMEDLHPYVDTIPETLLIFFEDRNQKSVSRRDSLTPRNEERTRVYQGVPIDPQSISTIVGASMNILRSATMEEMTKKLRPFAERAKAQSGKNRWEVAKNFHFRATVSDAFHHALERTSSFDRTIGNRSAPGHDTKYSFEPRHVPQLFWLDDFMNDFSGFFVGINTNFARRFCSMSLVKLSGQYSWADTAQALELPTASSCKMANKAVGVLAVGDVKIAFGKKLHKIARRLSADQEKIDYSVRRAAFSNFLDIPTSDWPGICAASGVSVGMKGGRRRYAAAFIWAEMTGGDWTLAPGIQDGNSTNLREVYRQLEKSLFPKMSEQLAKYGMEFLKAATIAGGASRTPPSPS